MNSLGLNAKGGFTSCKQLCGMEGVWKSTIFVSEQSDRKPICFCYDMETRQY